MWLSSESYKIHTIFGITTQTEETTLNIYEKWANNIKVELDRMPVMVCTGLIRVRTKHSLILLKELPGFIKDGKFLNLKSKTLS
jgi:hypothetical protein